MGCSDASLLVRSIPAQFLVLVADCVPPSLVGASHFVGEVLLGTYHAFMSSELVSMRQSSSFRQWGEEAPPDFEQLGARSGKVTDHHATVPARIIIPWTTSWQNRDLNEVVLKKAFDAAGK
jgi:hypothetical protein